MIRGRLAKAVNLAIDEFKAAPVFRKEGAGLVVLETAAQAVAQLEQRILDLEAAQGIGEGAQCDR